MTLEISKGQLRIGFCNSDRPQIWCISESRHHKETLGDLKEHAWLEKRLLFKTACRLDETQCIQSPEQLESPYIHENDLAPPPLTLLFRLVLLEEYANKGSCLCRMYGASRESQTSSRWAILLESWRWCSSYQSLVRNRWVTPYLREKGTGPGSTAFSIHQQKNERVL